MLSIQDFPFYFFIFTVALISCGNVRAAFLDVAAPHGNEMQLEAVIFVYLKLLLPVFAYAAIVDYITYKRIVLRIPDFSANTEIKMNYPSLIESKNWITFWCLLNFSDSLFWASWWKICQWCHWDRSCEWMSFNSADEGTGSISILWLNI